MSMLGLGGTNASPTCFGVVLAAAAGWLGVPGATWYLLRSELSRAIAPSITGSAAFGECAFSAAPGEEVAASVAGASSGGCWGE